MEPLRIVIVDDEPLARERLRLLLDTLPGVELAAECGEAEAAVDTIRRLGPDLVFLDVQMPGMDGFGLAARLGDDLPAVVFCTAYDEYAVRAFDANAVDYLLKPVDAQRLERAVERARRRMGPAASALRSAGVAGLLAALGRGGGPGGRRGPPASPLGPAGAPAPPAALGRGEEPRARLAVRDGQQFTVVPTAEIEWIEAADNHVLLHTASRVHRHRATMGQLEGSLDPRRFLRIHRSIIVNVEQVGALEAWGLGEFVFVLRNGRKLYSSRRYRKEIRRVFGC